MGTVSPWPETLPMNKKRFIQELVHGQECATQLQMLFDNPCEESGHLSAKELVQNILRCFNQTLSALTSSIDSADQVSQNQTSNCNDVESPCCDEEEGYSETRKRPVSKDKRGCYKRKRGVETWKIVSVTMEDGHAWRKYGQKKILNSKNPRGYFRCSRKYDQGCKAMKQVQRMEDDGQMYEITYIGTHTCIDTFRVRAPPAQMIIPDCESWESHLVVGSQIPNPSAAFQSVKKEQKEETIIKASDCTDLDSMVWKEIMGGGFEYSSQPGVESNYEDCRGLECGFLNNNNNKGVEFENGFHFDVSECPLMV